ncbi:MAG: hypothetical protein K2N48_06350 [Muribaculaceae bacterium]|nr:hypothetical protein [Muribaculaceae bacterium]
MRSLSDVCGGLLGEGILGDVESGIEDYIEELDKMKKDLAWVRQLKAEDAPHYEAALFNVTQDGFRQATNHAPTDFKRSLGDFMLAAWSPWTCYNTDDDIDNWEERSYAKSRYPDARATDSEIVNADPDDYRWNWHGSGSFYNFYWDPDYIHSLDQEDLLDGKKCKEYTKKLLKVAKKYGLNVRPIFP